MKVKIKGIQIKFLKIHGSMNSASHQQTFHEALTVTKYADRKYQFIPSCIFKKKIYFLNVRPKDRLIRVITCIFYLTMIFFPCRGTFVEFRSSMLNLCPVGRSCSQKEREAFAEFDKVHVRW